MNTSLDTEELINVKDIADCSRLRSVLSKCQTTLINEYGKAQLTTIILKFVSTYEDTDPNTLSKVTFDVNSCKLMDHTKSSKIAFENSKEKMTTMGFTVTGPHIPTGGNWTLTNLPREYYTFSCVVPESKDSDSNK